MDKRSEFNTALKEAMRNKDQVALSTIRLINAAVKDKDLTARAEGRGDGASDSEILSMLQTMIKQRHESIKTYREAGRDELADREEHEIEVIESFLPQQMSEEDVSIAIDETIKDTGANDIKDMGKVMAALKERYAGQMDMGSASKVVRDKLAA